MFRKIFLGILFLVLPLSWVLGGENTLDAKQISISYWNDNHLIQRQLSAFRLPGDDDYMTASFRLQFSQIGRINLRSFEFYYSIFTDRDQGYRYDMFAYRLAREGVHKGWSYRYAAGGLIRGDLGGDELQNAYHRANGYQLVELDQLPGYRLGGIGLIKLSRSVIESTWLSIQPFVTLNARIGAGPSAIRTGVESTFPWSLGNLAVNGSLQLRLGYVNYLVANDIIEPAFDKGPVFGIMLNMALVEKLGISFWYTENQYGLNDPHYGLTLHFSTTAPRFGGFSAVMFP
ncbi:MAG: hypothetical protein K9M49_09825 [Candidatus Marinimicrobia bacterium]|nr:hypothetical protein [Candidatus Neomarinimicrobiota bacterium]MCF7850040.1 hypothetical protein [Candidatus Neomarinimicrobiota bacterium]MCF7905432.1 hypothetical protein [Candidatus Neomarinimicrobiota bacterium]